MGETAFAATWLARTVESLCATTGAVTVRTATVRALRLAAAKTCGRGTAGSDVRTGDSVRAEPVPAFGSSRTGLRGGTGVRPPRSVGAVRVRDRRSADEGRAHRASAHRLPATRRAAPRDSAYAGAPY